MFPDCTMFPNCTMFQGYTMFSEYRMTPTGDRTRLLASAALVLMVSIPCSAPLWAAPSEAAPSPSKLAPPATCALASVAPETVPGYLLAHPVDPSIRPLGNLTVSIVDGSKVASEDYLVIENDGTVAAETLKCISSCPDPSHCVVLGCNPDTARRTCTICGCDGGDGVTCGQCSCRKEISATTGTLEE